MKTYLKLIGIVALVVAIMTSCDGISTETGDLPIGVIAFSEDLSEIKEEVLDRQFTHSDIRVVDDTEQNLDGDSETDSLSIRSRCVKETISMTSNPKELVLYGLDNAITWPGALIQGEKYRNGTLRSLNIDPKNRGEMTIVVSNLVGSSGSFSKTLTNPSFSEVSDAIKTVVADAYNNEIPSGEDTSLKIVETKNLQRAMIKLGMSGKANFGLGHVKAKLDSKIVKNKSHQTIVIHLVQSLFEVDVQEPASQESWFKGSFYESEYNNKKEKGEISEVNPPIYVSSVTYGRVLTATISSTASYQDLRLLIEASKGFLGSGTKGSFTAKQTKILSTSEKELFAIGGDNSLATEALSTGDWGKFFSVKMNVSEAKPISIRFKNVYDNSPAGVTETTEVVEERCDPVVVKSGPLDFRQKQVLSSPDSFDSANQLIIGEFDENEGEDYIWMELSGNTNKFYLASPDAFGSFSKSTTLCGTGLCDLSDLATSWGAYTPYAADLNGDGYSDIMWLANSANGSYRNIKYLLSSNGKFHADELKETDVGLSIEDPESLRTGVTIVDLNKDGLTDIVFTFSHNKPGFSGYTQERFIYAKTVFYEGAVSFHSSNAYYGPSYKEEGSSVENYLNKVDVKDINDDGNKDIIWSYKSYESGSLRTMARWRINTSSIGGDVSFATLHDGVDSERPDQFIHSSHNGWDRYETFINDFSGDGNADLVYVDHGTNTQYAIHSAIAVDGKYSQTNTPYIWPDNAAGEEDLTERKVLSGDETEVYAINANGDGSADILAVGKYTVTDSNIQGTAIALVKSVANGSSIDFSQVTSVQDHPFKGDWDQINRFIVRDINGDGYDDVIWNHPAKANTIYVGLMKTPEITSE